MACPFRLTIRKSKKGIAPRNDILACKLAIHWCTFLSKNICPTGQRIIIFDAISSCVTLRYIFRHIAIVLNLGVLAERVSDVFTGLLDLTTKLVTDLRRTVQSEVQTHAIERSIRIKCKAEYKASRKYTVKESGRVGVYLVGKASLPSANEVQVQRNIHVDAGSTPFTSIPVATCSQPLRR